MHDSILPLIHQYLPLAMQRLLQELADLAGELGMPPYLVGGTIRDLLLAQTPTDLDVVVEGDAPRLARELARAHGGTVLEHERFGTASYRWGGLTLDVATARAESYPHPGALPLVREGSLQEDLARRDFTINAMAAELDADRFGQIIDPFGGRDDLAAQRLRVLHRNSFVDDPTRLFRALRYEQRLGFSLEATTGKLLREGVSGVAHLSADRLRHEVEHILEEATPEKALSRAEELGLLATLHPGLRADAWLAERFRLSREAGQTEVGDYLALLACRLGPAGASAFCERLNLDHDTAELVGEVARLWMRLAEFSESLEPLPLYRRLHSFSGAAVTLAALAADHPTARSNLHRYLDEIRYVKPVLGGDDLLRLGVPAGPEVGRLLDELHAARLEGQVASREDEEHWVRDRLASS